MELARKFFSVICLSRPGSPQRGCAGLLSRPGVAIVFSRMGLGSGEQGGCASAVDAGGFPVMAYVFTWSGYIESGILSFWAPLRQGGRPG